MGRTLVFSGKFEPDQKDIDRAKSCTSEAKAIAQMNAITDLDKLFRRCIAFVKYSQFNNSAKPWMDKAKILGASDEDINRLYELVQEVRDIQSEIKSDDQLTITSSDIVRNDILIKSNDDWVGDSVTDYKNDVLVKTLFEALDHYKVKYKLIESVEREEVVDDIKMKVRSYLLECNLPDKLADLSFTVRYPTSGGPSRVKLTDESDQLFTTQIIRLGEYYDEYEFGDWMGWILEEYAKNPGKKLESYKFTELKNIFKLPADAKKISIAQFNEGRIIGNYGYNQILGAWQEFDNSNADIDYYKKVRKHAANYVKRMASRYHGNPAVFDPGEWDEIAVEGGYDELIAAIKLKYPNYHIDLSSGDDYGGTAPKLVYEVKTYPRGTVRGLPRLTSTPIDLVSWYNDNISKYPDLADVDMFAISFRWLRRKVRDLIVIVPDDGSISWDPEIYKNLKYNYGSNGVLPRDFQYKLDPTTFTFDRDSKFMKLSELIDSIKVGNYESVTVYNLSQFNEYIRS